MRGLRPSEERTEPSPRAGRWQLPGAATSLNPDIDAGSHFTHQHPYLAFVLGSQASGDEEFTAFSASFSIFGLLGS